MSDFERTYRESMEARIRQLEAELTRLREALEHAKTDIYADEEWQRLQAERDRLQEFEAGSYQQMVEIERLRAELTEAHQAEAHACQQRDRLREQNSEAVLLVAQLRRRNGRLRKAVNWLRGANHDAWLHPNDKVEHQDTPDHCAAWECQRARDILAEGTSDE